MATKRAEQQIRKNFSESDRQLLVSLVEPFADILKEAKKDTATNKKKETAWEQIKI